jgi:hypothetical protein
MCVEGGGYRGFRQRLATFDIYGPHSSDALLRGPAPPFRAPASHELLGELASCHRRG